MPAYMKRSPVEVPTRSMMAGTWGGCPDIPASSGVASGQERPLRGCNPNVVEAMECRSRKLISCLATFYNDARAQYLAQLLEFVPNSLKRAFLCNSGAEAI